MEKGKKEVLQWHPAFYAGLQIEFEMEAEKLIFESEHQLGTRPKEIDVLIIKKDANTRINKNIGRIFRKYNILEYKSPDDYLSIDDFYKVYGYACFYKADTGKTNQIKADDITISFVSHKFPHKLMTYLEEDVGLCISKMEDGIYYIEGALFPIQLIHTSTLPYESNLWLRNLTNHLQEMEVVNKLAVEYQRNRENKLYKSVMDIIIRANKEVFEEEKVMCEAIRELFWEEWVELEKGLEATKQEIEAGKREIEIRTQEFEERKRKLLEESRESGFQKGQERLLQLMKKMTENGAVAQITRLYEEEEFLQEMYVKYQV